MYKIAICDDVKQCIQEIKKNLLNSGLKETEVELIILVDNKILHPSFV